MDFDKVVEAQDKVIVKNVKNFELQHVFDCGQCFRWREQTNGNYIGVAFGKVIEVGKEAEDLILYNATIEDFYKIWMKYFDLNRNYEEIKKELRKDPLLKKSIEFGNGIRILRQEPFETVISFIISANKKIPMIKKSIESICEKWGEPLFYKGRAYYSFPSVETLYKASLEELTTCAVGYRARYIKDTVEILAKGICDLNWIESQQDEVCYKELQSLCGVGPKVADCIMLFSMAKYYAFPVDVWVKRAMQYFYLAPDVPLPKIREFAQGKFKELSGFSQQYLFYYARENEIRID